MKLPITVDEVCPEHDEKLKLRWSHARGKGAYPFYVCPVRFCEYKKDTKSLGLAPDPALKKKNEKKSINNTIINGKLVPLDRFGHPIKGENE